MGASASVSGSVPSSFQSLRCVKWRVWTSAPPSHSVSLSSHSLFLSFFLSFFSHSVCSSPRDLIFIHKQMNNKQCLAPGRVCGAGGCQGRLTNEEEVRKQKTFYVADSHWRWGCGTLVPGGPDGVTSPSGGWEEEERKPLISPDRSWEQGEAPRPGLSQTAATCGWMGGCLEGGERERETDRWRWKKGDSKGVPY